MHSLIAFVIGIHASALESLALLDYAPAYALRQMYNVNQRPVISSEIHPWSIRLHYRISISLGHHVNDEASQELCGHLPSKPMDKHASNLKEYKIPVRMCSVAKI